MKPSLFLVDLFVGGHPDLILVESRTGVATGLTGCVRSLRINDREYDLRKGNPSSYIGDALYGLDIGNYLQHCRICRIVLFRARLCVSVCVCAECVRVWACYESVNTSIDSDLIGSNG